MDLRTYVFIFGGVGLLVWLLSMVNFPFVVVPILLFFGGLIFVVVKEVR